jgi:trehalose-6-phosphate synthase
MVSNDISPFIEKKQSPNKIITTGSIHYTPIRFLHQSIDKIQLAALYSASDMCLVTAIRDGMNLVSYEYVACQQKRNGVLLLGKRIGAANTLKGAVLIEPLDAEDVAENIQRALKMPAGERRSRQETSIKTVMTQTSAWWGNEFVRKLRDV